MCRKVVVTIHRPHIYTTQKSKYMKIVTLSRIGYNAPQGANWSYGIWKIDLIDTENVYCMSYTVKENFGGDSRLRSQFPQIIETKGVYPSQKITGVRSMPDMESKEIAQIINDFLAQK